ncbi:YicC/YloC family endoribonuclease [Pelagibius sp. Alg239-R121]|uniref:YicC/YloC family endoribonuclease n=1 Tax=Pelagibius sp. Alg239-R121 TaxID=2993448 RepID=UPI0024A76285|nr:YicC/YloC family endoribonuclease [Pelagibius sp. Alg239-R121]
MSENTGVLSSMTGFSRKDGGDGSATWSWEIKSVNGRNLDLRCRLANGYEDLDPIIRTAMSESFARGNFQLNLTLDHAKQTTSFQVNREVLAQLKEVIGELECEIPSAPARLDGLLGLRGVIETVEDVETEEQVQARKQIIREDLMSAISGLRDARREEGQRLDGVVRRMLTHIAELIDTATGLATVQPDALRTRLREQVAALLEASPALPEERLAQEAALLITKADIREELDRLRSHVEAAQELLDQAGPCGRRLDFLCQEFNREANTLCSKSSDVELTRIGLELKATIEQFREQIQNLE